MAEVVDRELLRRAWRQFADTECGAYSPLYAAISHAVADDADLLALTAAAPPSGRQPNVLLAAAHYLVLGGLAHPLAEVYAGRAEPDQAPALFRDLCLSHRSEVERLLAGRHTQTNEPGRAALLAMGLGPAVEALGRSADASGGKRGRADEQGSVSLLDAGCSAGLNLLLDRYRFDYAAMGGVGPADSPVVISCEPRGDLPVPTRLPRIAARLGIDRSPVDVTDADDVRWLLACVWPDTGRLARTAAAIELARQDPPTVIAGDMVTDLDAALDRLDPDRPIVVVTTSACGYLSEPERHEFVAILARRARRQPLAWLTTDPPGVIDVVPVPATTGGASTLGTVLGLVTFDTGSAAGLALGVGHSHGAWLEWTGG